MVEINTSSFLSRLNGLQKLCSDLDEKFPLGLLFICGQDGRNNRGSSSILKYLFTEAVGKDLLEGSIEMELEDWEEMVLLVQQSSVSVLWTHAMKKKLSPYFYSCPHLIEYVSSLDEEQEIDALQSRKCCDFKRMIIETIGRKGGIGIPIPIGYEDVQDIESWPLLQAFAIDEVYCPTGFFTSSCKVIDVTEYLEVLFRSVDGCCVSKCIDVTKRTVLPHALQMMRMLDADTAEQRSLVTAEEALGPLDMLFEFAELDCALPVDPNLKPFVLFGPDTEALGRPAVQFPRGWQSRTAAGCSHVVVEGSEPSCSIRYCRTYFLQCGKSLEFLFDSDALVDDAAEGEDYDHDDDGPMQAWGARKAGAGPRGPKGIPHVSPEVAAAIVRLQALYVKLWTGMRATVRSCFPDHSDALEAASAVQAGIEALMTRELLSTERLQVHVDCFDALGSVVTIEDVDDMGGACWIYIRVSVHGIVLPSSDYGRETDVGAVAVGDTFLFSTATREDLLYHSAPPIAGTGAGARAGAGDLALASGARVQEALSHLGDALCLTHPIPYLFVLPGAGAEDRSAQRLLSCTKSPRITIALGLGSQIDNFGTGVVQLPILTDDPLTPVTFASLRPFSEGFVIEKMVGSCLPVMVCLGVHVEAAWTMDSADVLAQARALLPPRLAGAPDLVAPDGLVVVFKLKAFLESEAAPDEKTATSPTKPRKLVPDAKRGFDDDEETDRREEEEGEDEGDDEGVFGRSSATADASSSLFGPNSEDALQKSIRYNPLQRALPQCAGAQYMALIIAADSRTAVSLAPARREWRDAMRVHDVTDNRGAGYRLPPQILKSFLVALDVFSFGIKDAVENIDPIRGEDSVAVSGDEEEVSAQTMLALVSASSSDPLSASALGTGFLPLRCVHAVSERQRLSRPRRHRTAAAEESKRSSFAIESAASKLRSLVVVWGHSGTGVLAVAGQISTRLSQSLSLEAVTNMAVLDLATVAASIDVNGRDTDDKYDDVRRGLEAFKLAIVAEMHRAVREAVADDASCSGGGARKAESTGGGGDEVLVVAVEMCAQFQPQLPAVLAMLCSTANATLSFVVSVVNASTLRLGGSVRQGYASKSAASPQGIGVGEEAWCATGHSLCSAGLCDLAVVIDGTAGRGFAGFSNWLEFTHTLATPATACLRLSASLLRLDDDTFEAILEQVRKSITATKNVTKRGGDREADAITNPLLGRPTALTRWGHPPPSSPMADAFAVSEAAHLAVRRSRGSIRSGLCASDSNSSSKGSSLVSPGKGLGGVRIEAPLDEDGERLHWNLASLAKVLQLLFPQAIVSSVNVNDTWVAPPLPEGASVKWFERMVLLSKVKVMKLRQLEATSRACSNYLLDVTKNQSDAVEGLRNSVLGIRGIVRMRRSKYQGTIVSFEQAAPDGSRSGAAAGTRPRQQQQQTQWKWATVEACAGAVVIRPVEDVCLLRLLAHRGGDESQDALVAQGMLDGADVAMLRRLFGVCASNRLRRRDKVTAAAVQESPQLLKQIQKRFGNDNLPNGWWFDGSAFIDVKGNRLTTRPDMDNLVDEYVVSENEKIDTYNQLINEVKCWCD